MIRCWPIGRLHPIGGCKKAAAKKAYSSKKASAKAKYKRAIASYKIVKVTSTKVTDVPFTIAAELNSALANRVG